MRFPDRLTGPEVASLMRKHHVTIKDLAQRMGVTQVRVREVCQTGLDKLGFIRDWLEGIRGSLTGEFTVGLERHPEIGQREQLADVAWMRKFKEVNRTFEGVFQVQCLDAGQWDVRLVWDIYRLQPGVFGIDPNQLWPGDVVKLDMDAWLGKKATSAYKGLVRKTVDTIERFRAVKGKGWWGSGAFVVGGPVPAEWGGEEVKVDPLRAVIAKADKAKRLEPKERVVLDGDPYVKVGREFLDACLAEFFYRNAAKHLTFGRAVVGPKKQKVTAFVVYEGNAPVGIITETRPNPKARLDGRQPFVAPRPQKASPFRSLRHALRAA